jgi:hypothetical protein
MKTTFASLATFVVLGVLSATDVDISYYYDFDRSETQPASGPAQRETQYREEETTFRAAAYDYIATQLGLGMILSELGREMRDLTSFKRCWLREERRDDLDGSLAGLCTALAGPL